MKRAKHQPLCDEEACTTPAAVEFKGVAGNSDTWFFSECCEEKCWTNLCEEHAEEAKATNQDEFPDEAERGDLTFLCSWCADRIFRATVQAADGR